MKKNRFNSKVRNVGKVLVTTGAVVCAGASQALAVLPTEADAAVTTVSTFGSDMLAAVWPVAGAITTGLVGIKLFKKYIGRATS